MSTNPILTQPIKNQQAKAKALRQRIHRMRDAYGDCLNIWPVIYRARYDQLAQELKTLEASIYNGGLNDER